MNRDQQDIFERDRLPAIPGMSLVWVELLGGWTYGVLKTTVPYANAKRLSWDRANEKYKSSVPVDKMKVYFPAASRDEEGLYTGDPKGKVGDRWLCYFNVWSRRWEVISGESESLQPFELSGAWVYGSRTAPPSADAKKLKTADNGSLTSEGQDTETIYFPLAPRGSDGKYTGFPFGGAGQRVWCAKWGSKWSVVYPGEICATAQLTKAWTYPGAAKTPYAEECYIGTYDGSSTWKWAPGKVVINNPLGPRDDDGYYAKIPYGFAGERYAVRWDPTLDEWEVLAQNQYTAVGELQGPWNYASGQIPRATVALFCYNRQNNRIESVYRTVTAYFPQAALDRTKSYCGVPVGRTYERVLLNWDPSSQSWWVAGAANGLTYAATATSTFAPGGSGNVTLAAAPSVTVEAEDCVLAADEQIDAGTGLVVTFCEATGKFLIIAARCAAGS